MTHHINNLNLSISASTTLHCPPPYFNIVVIGFTKCNNEHTCELQPDSCKNVVLESNCCGLKTLLLLVYDCKGQVGSLGCEACWSYGCCISFVVNKCTVDHNGPYSHDEAVQLVDVLLSDNQDQSALCLYHNNDRNYSVVRLK